jgi:hypothetical protein
VRLYPHKINGVVTISDICLRFIARACEILRLPTSLLAAYFLAGDKGATRKLGNAVANKKEVIVLNAALELDVFLEQAESLI